MNYKRYLKKKKFLGVNLIGWGTLALVMIGALVIGLVPNAIVVPVTKNSQWVIFYADAMDRWQLDSSVAKQDFENQGWTIINKVSVEGRSEAIDGWNKFTNDYSGNPAICLIESGQTPIYGDGPYYWGWFTHREWELGTYTYPATSPGTVGYDTTNEWINGNARQWNTNDYVLIKFITYQGRSVIIVWTSIRFDTGQLTGYVIAWRWVCVYAAYHEKNWYVLDYQGRIVDSEVIPSDEAEPTGDNPEDNPLVGGDDDYTDPDEPLPEATIYDPMRQTRAILLIAGLLAVLVAMGGFTLWFGKKIGLFI